MAIRKFSLVLAAAVVGSAAISARASTIDLAAGGKVDLNTLITNGDSVLVGDKLFSNFGYAGTGDAPASIVAGYLNVIGLGTDPIADPYGIEFQGNITDLGSTSGGTDVGLTYTVTVTDPSFVITDMGLNSNVKSVGGASSGDITEQITASAPPSPIVVGVFNENFNVDGNTNRQITDEKTFATGYTSLSINKDIALNAVSGSNETVSFIDQTFSESPLSGGSQVPTPQAAWMGLSLMGGIGAFSVMRKHRSMA